MFPTLRAMAAAVIVGIALLAIPAAEPPVAAGVGPLPVCRLIDVLTSPRDYDSWATTLVDWNLEVGPDYAPPDLVSISAAGVTGGGQIREVAFDDLKAMADAARAAGTPLGNVSAYRSYRQQKRLFNSYVNGYGYNKAITFSARPGHSEHQLGLTIDFAPAGATDFVSEAFGAGKWLSRNAWKYGWLMSYPNGKKSVTCYRYEPWHYRYVGRELAKAIHDSGLTTREYLWAHYTTAQVPGGSPGPSSTPGASPGSSASPIASGPVSPAPSSSAIASAVPSVPGPTTPPDAGPAGAGGVTDLVMPLIAVAVALIGVVGVTLAGRRRGRPGG